MILPDKKIIFIHIPKCGGSSIERALARHADETIIEESKASFTLRYGVIQRQIEQHFNITFGEYKHLTAKQYKEFLGKEYNDYYVFSVIRSPVARIKSLIRWSGIEALNDDTIAINLKYHNSWYPANKFLQDDEGNIIVDKVLHFNNLSDEFFDLINNLNIKHINLPHLNKAEKSVNKHLDVNVEGIVQKYYSEELKLYNDFF
jgi:hypothetical protein